MAATDLTTLAKVKTQFEIRNSTDDELLGRLITAASAFIGNYTGRGNLVSSAATEYYDGTGTAVLMLRRYPITAVASLKVEGLTVPAAGAYPASGFVFDSQTLALRGYAFPKGVQNVEVTYTAGYAQAALPADLEQACIDLVGFKYKNRQHPDETSKTLAGNTTSYIQDELPKNLRLMLDNFRRVCPV